MTRIPSAGWMECGWGGEVTIMAMSVGGRRTSRRYAGAMAHYGAHGVCSHDSGAEGRGSGWQGRFVRWLEASEVDVVVVVVVVGVGVGRQAASSVGSLGWWQDRLGWGGQRGRVGKQAGMPRG